MCVEKQEHSPNGHSGVVGPVLVPVASFLHNLGTVVFPSGLCIGSVAGPVLQ